MASPSPRKRLCILECDQSLDPDRSLYGGYGGLIKRWLCGNEVIARTTEITVYDVVNSQHYPDLDHIDAVLISGSPTSVLSHAPWVRRLIEWVREVLSRTEFPTRIIGICFGHQVIGAALGYSIVKSDEGLESSLTMIDLTPEGRDVFGRSQLALNQMHSDFVHGTNINGAVSLGRTAFCCNQGLWIPHKVISLQAHPEFYKEAMEKVLGLMKDSGSLADIAFEDAKERNTGMTDGDVVREALAKFLYEGQ